MTLKKYSYISPWFCRYVCLHKIMLIINYMLHMTLNKA